MDEKIDINIKQKEFKSTGFGAYVPGCILSLPRCRLPDAEKLLLCRIIALSKKKGFCYASNMNLAMSLGKSKPTIGRLLSCLKQIGYISTYEIRNAKNMVTERRIFLVDEIKPFVESNTPIIKNDEETHINNDELSGRENLVNRDEDTGSNDNNRPITFKEANRTLNCCEEIRHVIAYYEWHYETVIRKLHPRLKMKQWEKVVCTLSDSEYGGSDESWWEEVIDKHFLTHYAPGCNFNILHFANLDLIQNRFYEIMR